jgi:malate dehydrogenase (oxaloacetate-decarboxylating)
MSKKLTVDELLAKAKKPAKIAVAYHPFYEGKVQVMPKCAICGPYDFAMHACIRC